jgi:hypothetical protein
MTDDKQEANRGSGQWFRFAPWLLLFASFTLLGLVTYFLWSNVTWMKEFAVSMKIPEGVAPEYGLKFLHLHAATVKRCVCLLSGLSTLLLGVGVMFYTIKPVQRLAGEGAGLKFSLATVSPGIVAVVVGALLVALGTISKDSFEPSSFRSPQLDDLLRPTTVGESLKSTQKP